MCITDNLMDLMFERVLKKREGEHFPVILRSGLERSGVRPFTVHDRLHERFINFP
jgi:hypothetical protein